MKAQKLAEIVNDSDTIDEAIARSGMSYNNLMTRCTVLRRKGYEIKHFPLVRQAGINSWLKDNYPTIHAEWQRYKKDNHIVP